MSITCSLDKDRYVVDANDCILAELTVSSRYSTSKTVKVIIGVCKDVQCNSADIVGETEQFTLEPNRNIHVGLEICGFQEAGLIGKQLVVCIKNVTDNKIECCDTFIVVTQIEEMMNLMMSMMPMLLVFPIIGLVISLIPKITEGLKR